jgi:hypothetical protein
MIEGTTDHVCLCPMVYCRCLSRITSPTVQTVCHGYAGGGLANSRLPCAGPPGARAPGVLRRARSILWGPPGLHPAQHLSVCLSVFLSVCLSVFLSVCLSQYLPFKFTAGVAMCLLLR